MRILRQRGGPSLALAPSFFLLALVAGPLHTVDGQEYPTLGAIKRHDNRLDRILPRDARMERLADGFDWSEGPVWIRDGGYLLFSDVPQNTVFRWKPREGTRVFVKPSGYTGSNPRGDEPGSNGLVLDAKGRLVL